MTVTLSGSVGLPPSRWALPNATDFVAFSDRNKLSKQPLKLSALRARREFACGENRNVGVKRGHALAGAPDSFFVRHSRQDSNSLTNVRQLITR